MDGSCATLFIHRCVLCGMWMANNKSTAIYLLKGQQRTKKGNKLLSERSAKCMICLQSIYSRGDPWMDYEFAIYWNIIMIGTVASLPSFLPSFMQPRTESATAAIITLCGGTCLKCSVWILFSSVAEEEEEWQSECCSVESQMCTAYPHTRLPPTAVATFVLPVKERESLLTGNIYLNRHYVITTPPGRFSGGEFG